VLASWLNGCSRPAVPAPEPVKGVTTMNWSLTSTAFANGARIPDRYAVRGEGVSPPLTWTAPPAGTRELALICVDPDAPRGDFIHWVLYGLGPTVTSLPEALPPSRQVGEPVCVQGMNSAGQIGYTAPAPPPGTAHRYQFTLYAVDAPLDLAPGADESGLRAALRGKLLGQTTLEGTYSR
jgi:hypothetical protein